MRDASTGRLMRASLAPDAWAFPAPLVADLSGRVDPDAAVAAAAFHGIAGYVRAAVKAANGSPALVAALEPAHSHGLLTHVRTLADLALVADCLGGADIPFAVLKGPVLAMRTHPRPDLRAYTDLDILVPPPNFGAAVTRLIEAGCEPVVTAWRALQAAGAGEIALTLPSGGALDLHWHTLNSDHLRAIFDVDPGAMVGRAVPARVGSVSVRVLDPADEFVYVAMHMVLSGADRLIWTKDVDLLIRQLQPPYETVVARARQVDAALVVSVAVEDAASTLDTPIPVSLRRELRGGSAWPALAALVYRASRAGSTHGAHPSLSRVVARSTRASTAASVRELAHRALASRQPPALRPGQRPPDVDQSTAQAEFTDWADGHAKSPARSE